MTKNIALAFAFLTGLGMIFIGARFLMAPETAEAGYGLHFNEHGDYAFHSIKGIRDLFSGLLICLLVLTRQTKALAITLLTGALIPAADLAIVLNKDYNGIMQAIPHIAAIVVCFGCGLILLRDKKTQTNGYDGFARILPSAGPPNESAIEYNIVPSEKTPWYYHTLFSETFEVLHGILEVGQNNRVRQLKKGDRVTIKPLEKHYFHNRSTANCLIKVTISPGNRNFEKALLILKGLAKDGLARASGVPKNTSDLALFIYLSNSRMAGIQKIAEPFFTYLAKRAIKKGRLNELELTYCNE